MARKSAALGATMLVALLAAPAREAIAQSACEQISAACEAAGFVRGGASAGNGILVDCVEPIIQGRVARRPGRALPPVAPQLIAQCRSEDSAFGRRKGGALGGA